MRGHLSRQARLGYVPALDGLRGVAIVLVVGYHDFGWPRGGWLGVDLFFVLSGFLITTLLLEEHEATGRVRLAAFYERRARRLLPALFALLAAYLAFGAAVGSDALGQVLRWGFYTGNVYNAFWPVAAYANVGLNHLWSLAQEEQFYLLWPAALLAVRKARNPTSVLAVLAAVLIAYRAGLLLSGASLSRVYYAPDTNLAGLVLGSALAFQRLRRPLVVPRALLAAAVAVAAPIVALVPPAALLDASVVTLGELASLVLVAAAVSGSLRLPRPLAWLGGISYSLYLWHFPVFWAFHLRHGAAAAAAGVALAWASTRFVERPFRRSRVTNRSGVSDVATEDDTRSGGSAVSGDEIVRSEEVEIERFVALGLGRYDAITAVEAGVDWAALARLVRERGLAPTVALGLVR